MSSIAHVIIPSLLPTPYDPIKDFAAVATIASNEQILVVISSVPANTLQELIALAKSRPGQLNYASSGAGTINHLTTEIFSSRTGIKLQHIPYKGGAPALQDLLGGQVQMEFDAPLSLLPHVRTGKLKAIAVSGKARLAVLPQVPTLSEAGLPNFEAKNWVGLAAPAATPKAIIDQLSAEIAKILVRPEVKENMVSKGVDPFISTPAQAATLMKADLDRFAKIIKAANIKVE